MQSSARRPRAIRATAALIVALAAALVVTLPAAAFNSGWTTPKRVVSHSWAPNHDMVVDNVGKAHVAVEKGSSGVWYATNAGGSWQTCQLSHGNDRQPSIAWRDGAVHIAFARRNDGQKGIYTASSNIPAAASDCGWAITKRFAGSVSFPSIGAHGGKLSIAFRTSGKKLKFIKGAANVTPWTTTQTIDPKCCTSPPVLVLTTNGTPRVAYGDGAKQAEGLKFAVRTSKGWKKSKVSGGRITLLDMVLNKDPGVITPPTNAPKIMYVVKKKGTYLGTKASSFAGGKWTKGHFGRHFGQPALTHYNSVTKMIFGGGGKLWSWQIRSAISLPPVKLTVAGDVKPHMDRDIVTFSRKKGNKGVYYTREK